MVRCGPSERQLLLALTRVAGAEVRAWAPAHLNQSQGSIFAPSLQSLSISELEEGFGRVGVLAVYRPPRASKVLILTFSTPEPPSHVRAAYLSEVRVTQPKPLRCTYCQKYGHRRPHCRASHLTCTSCSGPHDPEHCPSIDLLCAACAGRWPSRIGRHRVPPVEARMSCGRPRSQGLGPS